MHRKVDSDVVRVDRLVAVDIKRMPPNRGWWWLVVSMSSSNALLLDSMAKARPECVNHPCAVWRDDRFGVVGPRWDGNALANKRSSGSSAHRRHHLFDRSGLVKVVCHRTITVRPFLLSCGECHSSRLDRLTD